MISSRVALLSAPCVVLDLAPLFGRVVRIDAPCPSRSYCAPVWTPHAWKIPTSSGVRCGTKSCRGRRGVAIFRESCRLGRSARGGYFRCLSPPCGAGSAGRAPPELISALSATARVASLAVMCKNRYADPPHIRGLAGLAVSLQLCWATTIVDARQMVVVPVPAELVVAVAVQAEQSGVGDQISDLEPL